MISNQSPQFDQIPNLIGDMIDFIVAQIEADEIFEIA